MASRVSKYPQICKDILKWTKSDTFIMWEEEKQKVFMQLFKAMCDQFRTGRKRSLTGDRGVMNLSSKLLAMMGNKKSKKRRSRKGRRRGKNRTSKRRSKKRSRSRSRSRRRRR